MNTTHPIYELAHAAGKAGRNYIDWLNSDEIQSFCDVEGPLPFDPDAVEAAFGEGVRADWKTAWTTAPEAYDGFGTATVESHPDFHGKVLRRVSVDPNFYAWQIGRYGSGCCGAWEEDPREVETKIKAELDRERAEREQREETRRAGLTWLATADDALLDLSSNDNYDVWQARGLRTEDVRAERDRRREAAESERRRATWERCAALVPEGSHLVDPGAPSKMGHYGRIPGRDPWAWRSVKIVPGWPTDDPDEAKVTGEGGEVVCSLELLEDWITSGRVRIAASEERIPPLAVMKRIGHRKLNEIREVEVNETAYWVGRVPFAYDPLVLDARGHLVRSKSVWACAVERSRL